MKHYKKTYICYVLLFITTCLVGLSWGETEADILLRFKQSLVDSESVLSDWNISSAPNPCSNNDPKWTGLRCNSGLVFGLKMEGMGLSGVIDTGTLGKLQLLRTLSFMNNSFDGPFPDVKKLTFLRALYLSYNKFSGKIGEDGFDGMNALQKVFLARNNLSGEIPTSLAKLPRLTQLSLEENRFEGKIPDFQQKGLTLVNLADNQLHGRIPASLSKMNSSFFAGNKGLCGDPLPQCKSSKKRTIIIIIVVAGSVVCLAIIAALSYVRTTLFAASHSAQQKKPEASERGGASVSLGQAQSPHHYRKADNSKLYFVRNDMEKFKLQELLRASAEVLGSGSFGSSYKAVLANGQAFVVKRFKQMNNVGKEGFHKHMQRLGTLSHPNLLPLFAFYYRKEEKLLVSDFVSNGSLASHLHTRRAPNEPGLDWPTRLKIIKGVAKGMSYLHQELQNLTLPHGHLKSSNVLLDQTFEPILTDYGLVTVMNKKHAQEFMVAYKSPEFTQHDRTTRKTDIWSLGILILELLTGKFPTNYLKQGKLRGNADLASWVSSVVREEWTGEVFDMDMKGRKNGEGEMLKLLRIGLCCCEREMEKRWDLKEAVDRIEELKERDDNGGEDYYSSYGSEGEGCGYSSRQITEEGFSFSCNEA